MRSFDNYGNDNDEHSNQCHSRGPGEFVDITVKGKWVGDTHGTKCDDKLTISEDFKDGYRVEGGE